VTTSFVYDGGSVLLEKQGSSTTATYTYGNALIRKDGETPLFDGLGSERTVTSSSQAVTATLTLSAFGQTVASSGSSTSAYMFGATSGYRTEGDAGLTLVGCRFYDAQVGRFITRDTVLTERPYAYCDGDPVNAIDPSGHAPKDIKKTIGELLEFILKLIEILTGDPSFRGTLTYTGPTTIITVNKAGKTIEYRGATWTLSVLADLGKGKGGKK